MDKFQILVVVLVVLAQAASALRSWYRRHRERRREEEARLGLPGDRGFEDRDSRQETEASASSELPDWDPFEEEPEAEGKAPSPPLPPRHRPLPAPVAAPAPAATIPQDLVPAETAYTMAHHRPAAGTTTPSRSEPTRRLGGLSLRQALLAREILSPPLSLRGRGGSIGRR